MKLETIILSALALVLGATVLQLERWAHRPKPADVSSNALTMPTGTRLRLSPGPGDYFSRGRAYLTISSEMPALSSCAVDEYNVRERIASEELDGGPKVQWVTFCALKPGVE